MLIRLFIVTRLFMNTLSGWKESQAALQVSRWQQLLDSFTAEMVLIFTGKKKLYCLMGTRFLFIPIYRNQVQFASRFLQLCTILMHSYQVASTHNVGSVPQNDTKGQFPASVFPLDDCILETHAHEKKKKIQKCLKTLFVVCCFGVFFFSTNFPQTTRSAKCSGQNFTAVSSDCGSSAGCSSAALGGQSSGSC